MTKCYVSRVLPPLPIEALDGWRTRARCNSHPTLAAGTWDDSIARETDVDRALRITRAKAECSLCPVRVECLADVQLAVDEGVRGGVDLRTLQPRRRRAS